MTDMQTPASWSVDLEAARRFLDLIAEGEAVTFQTFADRRARGGLAAILHGTLDDCAERLVRLNVGGAGAFFMVNHGDGKGRRAENVTGVRALFLDLDGDPLAPVLAASPEPHAIIESSPGRFHAYWLVDGCSLAQFGPYQKALAARFHGDPSVHDLPRVMRVPGFVHHKGAPFVSRLVSLQPMQPYGLDELAGGLSLHPGRDDAPTAPPAPAQGQPQPFGEGGRNAALARLAGKLRRDGLSQSAIEGALLSTNAERCVPPLDDDEVRRIARNIGRYPAGSLSAAPMPPAAAEPAQAPSWPEPMLPGTSRVPDIGADVLGGWPGAMAAAVSASAQTPPAMAVMSVLAVLAAVLQRRFEVAPYGDDYREPLSLWTMVVLGSGNRKTAVHKAVTQVLVDWEKRERDRKRSEIARVAAQRDVIGKRIEMLKQQAGKEDDAAARGRIQDHIAQLREEMPDEVFAPRIFSGDVTSERLQQLLVEQDERIAVLSDEGGIFSIMAGAYSGGVSSLDVFLQGHAGAAMRVDRAGRLAHIDRPALSFGLALQPGILQDTGKARRFRDSGLMARFLYAVPRSTVGQRDVRHRVALDEGARQDFERQVLALLDHVPRPIGAPRVLPFEHQARECWLDLCEEIERGQGEGGRYAHMADWTSKLPGAAARIAGVLALAELGIDARAVPLRAVRQAVDLARLLIPHAEAAFALMGAADGETDAQALLAYLQRHRPAQAVRRELQKAMEGRFRSLDRMLTAIRLLQDWHVLGPERKTGGAGRPSIYYEVNPRAFVDKAHSSPRSE